MCLIFLAWRAHADYPLLIAANRDEHFIRPTAAVSFWHDVPQILAGRDLQAGGTWFGVTCNGRFAALTNYRQPEKPDTAMAPSRGRLVSQFLMGNQPADAYLADLAGQALNYRGFNLLCGNLVDGLWHYANRDQAGNPAHRMQRLTPGIHGLSNHLLNVPWPKVEQGKTALADGLDTLPHEKFLCDLLRDERRHPDDNLPQTGISLEMERILSAAFIRSPGYGTRSSTLLKYARNGFLTVDEQTWLADATPGQRHRFHFKPESISG